MKIIGLTGGIGSGKSTVARLLAELGAGVLDADKAGHAVLQPGTGAYQQVIREFGPEILLPGGEIDRHKLGEIIFNDNGAREKLQNIMYPEIDKILLDRLEEYRRQGKRIAVLEAAVMLESGKNWQVDEIWTTVASEATVLDRIKDRPSLSREEARQRIRSQMSNKDRIKKADVVINTECSLGELEARVKQLWEGLVEKQH
jgi:dephospho-CoA kinase